MDRGTEEAAPGWSGVTGLRGGSSGLQLRGGGGLAGAGAGQAAPQIHVGGEAGPARHVSGPHVDKCFRVVFLGGREVGKSSIVDQFMSSEHADVYEDNEEEDSRHTRERSVRTSCFVLNFTFCECKCSTCPQIAHSRC